MYARKALWISHLFAVSQLECKFEVPPPSRHLSANDSAPLHGVCAPLDIFALYGTPDAQRERR